MDAGDVAPSEPNISSSALSPILLEGASLSSVSEPPRKRQRTELLELHPSGSTSLQDPGHSDSDSNLIYDTTNQDMIHAVDAPVRDEKYYIEGADCAIRVENTLFRVHRFLLARDSSAFQDMFTLPPGEEGSSDESPIHLFGENVEEFRALLSVFYALPREIAAYSSSSADIPQLLTIASIANKYHYATTTLWAISTVHAVTSGLYGRPTHPLADLSSAPSSMLGRAFEVAHRCGHAQLENFIVELWSARMYNLRDKIGPRAAMRVADRYENAKLKGVAYYVQLMQAGTEFDLGAVAVVGDAAAGGGASMQTNSRVHGKEDIDELIPLTRHQRACLLSGFYSLINLWDHLRLTPPVFARPDGCTYHNHGCITTFSTVWRDTARSETTEHFRQADVLGRLRSMETQMKANGDLYSALSPMCKSAAMAAVRDVIRQVEDTLATNFVDLTNPKDDLEIRTSVGPQ